MRVHLASRAPRDVRPDSNVRSFLLSSMLSLTCNMLLSFLCRVLYDGASKELNYFGMLVFATPRPNASSTPRAPPPFIA